jgi:hypothetical protein
MRFNLNTLGVELDSGMNGHQGPRMDMAGLAFECYIFLCNK